MQKTPDFSEDEVSRHWRAAAGLMLHDFGDSKGSVRAHRHMNPLGDLGGWVANTAFVDPTAYVAKHATVTDRAHVGKQVLLRDGATVSGEAQVSGPIILGKHVRFSGTIQCRYSCRIKHPIYIGYSGLLTGKTLKFGAQDPYWEEAPSLPAIVCEQHHPIINRWFAKGCLHTMIMLDESIVFVTLRRGYKSISDYNDNNMFLNSPHGMSGQSWKRSELEVVVANSINTLGLPPDLQEHLDFWPKDDSVLTRVGRMPNTVKHPRLYMKW